MRARRISSRGLKPQPTCGAGAAAAERGATASAAAGAGTAAAACPGTDTGTGCTGCAAAAAGLLGELLARIGFAILEAVADKVAESAGTAVPSRQVSIIVDDGRFGAGAAAAAAAGDTAATDATDGAEVLVFARVVLDPVAIAGEALAASPTAAEQPLSAGAPDFFGGGYVGCEKKI